MYTVKLPPKACVMYPTDPSFKLTSTPAGIATALTSRCTTMGSFS